MSKGLKLFIGILTVFILSGLTSRLYAAQTSTTHSFTLKTAALKDARQLAAELCGEVLHTGFNFQQQLNYSQDLHAEAAIIQQDNLQYPAFANAPQISSIYKILYHRFLLYPFHAFW
ncbi:hypothetical protein SAMN05192574_101980 [Mucilaginibacter gossypiicola]|uniref:Uncharacterized protein n=1 Tax=Mucilaginibacter gossypiicola TaxID=551995 RepID=A0A1H8BQR3_9SPHI|nr:hypothetical protein [Mucilaginibacter gossypiicola]SEM84247.1 hypothetical protein SAMN05192574_101980 [Mucilaginibacter gossypiicola]